MHDNMRHRSLTFPSISVNKNATPLDLERLLYKGGASLRVSDVDRTIQEGLLGSVLPERLALVYKAHEFIEGLLAGGGSPVTATQQIAELVRLFAWADQFGGALSIFEVENTYFDWAEHLLHRVRVARNLSARAAYSYARLAGQVLDGALDRKTPLLKITRHRSPDIRKTPQGVKSDKQLLKGTFAFGHLLQDICDGLTLDVIWGPRPVCLTLHNGHEIEVCATGRPRVEKRVSYNVRLSVEVALAYEKDLSLENHTRKNLANLRIQAELLMFIGQTGMNLTQAQLLQLRSFSYSSDIDGYKVKEYKPRRQGEVLFEIFSEYRNHLERYLEWRRKLFPKSEQRLFPLMRPKGTRDNYRPPFGSIKEACKNADVPWTAPSTLRGTRINWLLRRSGDPDMTAELAQHHKQTLLRVYEIPSLQVAISEITRFHLRNDPSLARLSLAVAPGECTGLPVASQAKPERAPEPDCTLPSGCLWCEHHRDIDSLDYVWSLSSFRYLKIIELSRHYQPAKNGNASHPADYAIQRLSEKLSWFRESNATRREWVEEALARVEEGNYHDQWSYLIDAIEGTSG